MLRTCVIALSKPGIAGRIHFFFGVGRANAFDRHLGRTEFLAKSVMHFACNAPSFVVLESYHFKTESRCVSRFAASSWRVLRYKDAKTWTFARSNSGMMGTVM